MKIKGLKKVFLSLLTDLQEIFIKGDGLTYHLLSLLHFRLYYGFSVKVAVMSHEMEKLDALGRAANKHGNMVVSIIFKHSSDTNKRRIKGLAIEAFYKNHLLNQRL